MEKTPWKSYSKLLNKGKSEQKQIIAVERSNDSPGIDVLSTYCFFFKRFDKLSQCRIPSITKKVNSYSLVLGQQPFIALQIQNFY